MQILKAFSDKIIVLSVACATMSLCQAYERHSFAGKLVDALESAVTTLKKNPECLDKIDELIQNSGDTIKTSIDKICRQIPKEQQKEIGKIVKIEFEGACKQIEAVTKQYTRNIELLVKSVVGNQAFGSMMDEINACGEQLNAKIKDNDTKVVFDTVVKELKPAGQELAQAGQVLEETLGEVGACTCIHGE